MTTGNLVGKIVPRNFWPRCSNCAHYAECRSGDQASRQDGRSLGARHPAFPHTWHWGHEAVSLPGGELLVLRSWVGTAAIGQPHTGCHDYAVGEGHARLPQGEEQALWERWEEIVHLERALPGFEARWHELQGEDREAAEAYCRREVAPRHRRLNELYLLVGSDGLRRQRRTHPQAAHFVSAPGREETTTDCFQAVGRHRGRQG